jgi:hypothetical protein
MLQQSPRDRLERRNRANLINNFLCFHLQGLKFDLFAFLARFVKRLSLV